MTNPTDATPDQYYLLYVNIVTLCGILVPAVWYLASRIQKLNGVIETGQTRTRERLKNLESRLVELANEIKELRFIERSFRERLVVVETQIKGRKET